MPRFLLALLALLLAAALVACGDDGSKDVVNGDQTGDEESSETDGLDDVDLVDPDQDDTDPEIIPIDLDTNDQHDQDVVIGECDPVLQNCGAGYRCILDFTTGLPACTLSTPAANQIPAGQACQTDRDDCADGLQCVTVGGTESLCLDICRQSDKYGCVGEEKCRVNMPVDSAYGFCQAFDTCNVLTQDCANDAACVGGNDPVYGLIFLCLEAGTLQQGETCVNMNDCAKGLTCIGVGGPRFCSAYCDETANPTTCTNESTCHDGTALGFVGNLENIGVCY